MAELLKRNYDVIALKVELLPRASKDEDVRFTLQYKLDGGLLSEEPWFGSMRAMGLRPEEFRSRVWGGMGPPIHLPPHLLDALSQWMERETDGSRPLWVHLVKPYGLLRFVPWEQLLGMSLNVPVLMLPDFIFPPPRETAGVLDVVLCASAPLGCEESSIYQATRLAIQRVREAKARRVRMHVFVDEQVSQAIRDEFQYLGSDAPVIVHDHGPAYKYALEDRSSRLLDRTGTLRSPWLLWMREALSGHGADVVHFVCHGHLSREQGALLFAQSPVERTDRYLAGPVGALELQTFLTQVGAWSVVFSSVSDNNSQPGLRALADQIAQSRPGPLMMHTLAFDPDALALGDGYRFLYADAPGQPPRTPALFLYCQPYLARDAVGPRARSRMDRSSWKPALPELARNAAQEAAALRPWGVDPDVADPLSVRRAIKENSLIDDVYSREEQVPTWVASTERFVEQVQLDLQQIAREDLLPGTHRELQERVARDMLGTLRSAVAEAAMRQPPGDAPPLGAWGDLDAAADDDVPEGEGE